ncbi:hypothetical protein [Citrifermentans bemidjiense]|uniref:hypothetical protein n=1 Tax=Citrifermentans bemidjiense TaxID=225194 RepID=UPI00059D9F81|nr:hypothetical protein [Citrifermentans bemidjiense]
MLKLVTAEKIEVLADAERELMQFWSNLWHTSLDERGDLGMPVTLAGASESRGEKVTCPSIEKAPWLILNQGA